MDPVLIDLFEPAVVFATLLGTAFGVKLLIWGKGPIRRVRRPADEQALAQRLSELEDRWEQGSDQAARQADQLAELEERLDFAERLLTRHRMDEPRALEDPEVSTPV